MKLEQFKLFFIVLMFLAGKNADGQINRVTVEDSSVYAYELEEIVLYGSRNFNNPSMITEFDSKNIESRNAVTVADLLKSDPGLIVTSGPKAEKELMIRGFPARDVLVLVDGHPINPGYYGKVDLSMLPLDNIAKINVLKGPSSVAYGMNNMGGVIDIITKNGFESPKTVFDLSLGDDQYRKISLNHSRQLFPQRGINYWISVYENYSNGFKLSEDFVPTSLEDGRLRDNSFYHKAGGNFKIGHETASHDLYSFSLGYHLAKKNIPTTIYSWDSPSYRKFPEWQRFSSALIGQWNLGSFMQLKSIVFLDAYQDRLIDFKSKEMRSDEINFDSYLESWTAGGSVESKFSIFNLHQIHSGIKFKRDLMNKKPDTDQPWETNITYTGNIFIQDCINLWEMTGVTAGISWLSFSGGDDIVKNKFSPMMSLSHNIISSLRTYISYANSVRVPTLHQLYSEISGNPDLKPEEADKLETGVEWYLVNNENDRYLLLQIAYFYNDLKNLIYRTSSSYRYRNISDAVLQGVEARSVFNYNSNFSCEVSYCYISSSGSTREILEEIPKNKLRFAVSVKISFGTQLNYEFNYFDNRTTFITTKNLDSYTVHNINISHQLLDFLKLRVELNNITDAYYEEELGYPSEGRIFIVGATLTF